jgi:YD repeat-containing protein
VGGYNTCYTFDVLGHLTQVAQGTQTRSYVYDAMGSLTRATMLESGTVTYKYDLGEFYAAEDEYDGSLDNAPIGAYQWAGFEIGVLFSVFGP